QLGTIALGAGGEVTVEFLADGLVELVIDQALPEAEANNAGELTAGGGLVVLQAGREDSWLSSVVNQSGTIKAEGVGVRDGRIVLTGGEVGLAGEMTASRAIDVRGETITVESQLDVKTDTSFSLRADSDVVFNDNAEVEALTPRGADDPKVEVILRADADADWTGTVVFDSGAKLHLDGAHAHIFYNPEDPDESNVGLFRAIGAGGVVRRIGMKNVEVTGDA